MDSGDNDDMVRLLSHSYSPPAEQQVTMPSDVISPRSSRIKRGSSGALGSAFDPTTVHAAASFQPPQDQTVGLRKPGSGTSFHQRFPSVALFDLEEPPVPPQHQTGTLTKNSSTKPSPEKKLLRQTSGGQLTSLTRLGLPEDVDILGPSPTTHQAFPSMLRDAQGTTTSHSETLHESPGRVSELGTESPSLPPLNKKKTAAGATRLDGIPSAHRQVFPPPLGIDFNLWLQSMQQWSHRPGGDPEPDLPWDAEDPEAPDQRFLFYSDASGLLQANHFESLDFSVLPGSPSETLSKTPYWLDVNFPTNSEMNLLSRIFGIHPLTTEDIQTPDTREKCEVFPNYYFICITTFEESQLGCSYMSPINFYLVVFKECILTFHFHKVNHSANVLRRIGQLRVYGLQVTPDWVNYALIDDITDSFIPVLSSIDIEVESIDDLVLILKETEQSDMLRRIGLARKKVMQMMKLLNYKPDVLKVIVHRCIERMEFDNDTRFYLGDIQDHVLAMNQNLAQYETTLSRAHSNYLAQISIEITQASNRTSDIVMKITAVASILIPLNVVTGLWGMNVHVPGQNQDSLAWFFGIVTGMIIFAVSLYWMVRRAKLV